MLRRRLALSTLLLLGLGACASAPERQPVAGIFPAYATAQGELGLVPLRWTDAALPVSITERVLRRAVEWVNGGTADPARAGCAKPVQLYSGAWTCAPSESRPPILYPSAQGLEIKKITVTAGPLQVEAGPAGGAQ